MVDLFSTWREVHKSIWNRPAQKVGELLRQQTLKSSDGTEIAGEPVETLETLVWCVSRTTAQLLSKVLLYLMVLRERERDSEGKM